MKIKTFNEDIFFDEIIQISICRIVENFELYNSSLINSFGIEKEFLEWYLNKKIIKRQKDKALFIQLKHQLTEEDLEKLKQLRDYFRL